MCISFIQLAVYSLPKQSPLLPYFTLPLPPLILKLSLSLFFSVCWGWMSLSLADQICDTAVKGMVAETTLTPPLPGGDKGTGRCSGGSLDSVYTEAVIQKVQVTLITFSAHHYPLSHLPCCSWSRNTMNYLFKEINHVLGNAVIKLYKCQETL